MQDKTPITSKCVFKTELTIDDKIKKLRAKLIDQGFEQKERMDYQVGKVDKLKARLVIQGFE